VVEGRAQNSLDLARAMGTGEERGQALKNGSADKEIFCNRETQRGRVSALKPKLLSMIHRE